MKSVVIALSLAAVTATAASAQSPRPNQDTQQQERVDAILGALFGDRAGGTSLDAQWSIGRFPLAQQRTQYESRIDADIRSRVLSERAGERAKADYRALVDLEARYGADRRFTQQERAELNERYQNLTNVLAEGGDAGGVSGGISVAEGRADFEARVDDAIRNRRITRAQGAQLKADYGAAVRLETDYMRDGVLSLRERDDLDSRLDALDARVGDVSPTMPSRPVDPATRLDAIARALPSSGLSTAAQAQLRVEHADLTRLAAAYRRLSVSTEDQRYLDDRLKDLETRARVRGGRDR